MKPVKRKRHLLRRRFRNLKRTHRGLDTLEKARKKRVRKLLHHKKAVLQKQQKRKQQNRKQQDKKQRMKMKQARRETAKLNRTLRRRRKR